MKFHLLGWVDEEFAEHFVLSQDLDNPAAEVRRKNGLIVASTITANQPKPGTGVGDKPAFVVPECVWPGRLRGWH